MKEGTETRTHCMRKGLRRSGFWLDQKRALHPMTSAMLAKTAVGSMNQRCV